MMGVNVDRGYVFLLFDDPEMALSADEAEELGKKLIEASIAAREFGCTSTEPKIGAEVWKDDKEFHAECEECKGTLVWQGVGGGWEHRK